MTKMQKMAKRRTKKDKLSARHQFALKWEPSLINNDLASGVKRQLKKQISASNAKTQRSKSANILAQEGSVKTIRLDIIKSLILASFILSLELVVYLVWTVL